MRILTAPRHVYSQCRVTRCPAFSPLVRPSAPRTNTALDRCNAWTLQFRSSHVILLSLLLLVCNLAPSAIGSQSRDTMLVSLNGPCGKLGCLLIGWQLEALNVTFYQWKLPGSHINRWFNAPHATNEHFLVWLKVKMARWCFVYFQQLWS